MVSVHTLVTKLVFICVILNVLACSSADKSTHNGLNKVQLTVFYETLCPYSMTFFTNQLSTLFNNDTQLYRYVNFDLVPFGKTHIRQVGAELMFECQHGPLECKYNKLHACVTTGISLINSNEVNRIYVPFLICLMRTTHEDDVLQECSERYQVPVDWLRHCQNGKTGAKLLARLGAKTQKFTPKITSVPTVVINGVYNDFERNLAETNLPQLICRNLRQKPHVCNLI